MTPKSKGINSLLSKTIFLARTELRVQGKDKSVMKISILGFLG